MVFVRQVDEISIYIRQVGCLAQPSDTLKQRLAPAEFRHPARGFEQVELAGDDGGGRERVAEGGVTSHDFDFALLNLDQP